MKISGKCSWFGGPNDKGVSPDEGLAFIYDVEDKPELFLPSQPPGTTGLARRLDPNVHYIACRWDYDKTSKSDLLDMRVLVRAKSTGRAATALPADWGPHSDTERIADISPGLMDYLGITTDDEVEVVYFDEGRAPSIRPAVVISSGHGKYIRGAEGPEPWGLDEVNEARRVVANTARMMRRAGVDVTQFHDNTSHDQNTNLETIVNFHNAQVRDLDVSVHFNAADPTTTEPRGTEVYYISQAELADKVSEAIAEAGGLIDRGPKKNDGLYFLNHTEMPAILIEVCFVDSMPDAEVYEENFRSICAAIATALFAE